ncbi:helix-turn-helix domain-containing protein, partial [Methylobacterium sp. J-070]|uniref:helix-turn-helix domain-containing protein n=1 Tax=Methylobacterium sp. J-070 TaxID=2836650 RepID=UPI001FBB172A|nr:helix-turn-helix domain-containing protein [Methylobacterium sp. J-070]
EGRPALRRLLNRYIQAQHVQTAQTAFANAKGNTATRLARWLLMCQDRLDDEFVTVTQEFMSFMLGVERPGVTAALRSLVQVVGREPVSKRHFPVDAEITGKDFGKTSFGRLCAQNSTVGAGT